MKQGNIIDNYSNTINNTHPNYALNKMRLAYCIPSLNHSGGMERVLTLKANYLADVMGFDVFIILTDGENTQPYFSLSKRIHIIQLNINIDDLWKFPIWKRFILYIIKTNKYKRKLKGCLYELKPNITISLLRREINFITKINDGSAKIGEIHFSHYKYREINIKHIPRHINSFLSTLWIKQLNTNLNKLARFVVLTEEDAKEWKGLNNISVIPNPLTIKPLKYSDCTAKKIIAVGRYTYQKGFDMLIKTWKIVHKSHPDWSLDIYGGGDNESYQNMANKEGLADSLHCNHAVANIQEKFVESSIFVLSSRFEGFVLALLEAMACGLPAVSYTCPCSPKEIINNNIDGILVERNNYEQLAEGLCTLIEDNEKRQLFGFNARVNIQRYQIDAVMKKWIDLFTNI